MRLANPRFDRVNPDTALLRAMARDVVYVLVGNARPGSAGRVPERSTALFLENFDALAEAVDRFERRNAKYGAGVAWMFDRVMESLPERIDATAATWAPRLAEDVTSVARAFAMRAVRSLPEAEQILALPVVVNRALDSPTDAFEILLAAGEAARPRVDRVSIPRASAARSVCR